MGFTHYFTQGKPVSDEQWQEFKKDAQVVIDYAQKHLNIVLMSNDSKNSLVDNDRVNLNGDDRYDLDHETFHLRKNGRGFSFCKTARKPYDLVVASLLLLAHEHMPDCYNIESDGSFEDWQDAMALNAKLFQRGYQLPESVESSDEVREYEQELATKYAQDMIKDEEKVVVTIVKNKKKSRYNL